VARLSCRSAPTGHNPQSSAVTVALSASNLTTIAQYMLWLMFRNIASDGYVFEDPTRPSVLSAPGCVLASPSWENTATHVTL
jgi:glucoamylase